MPSNARTASPPIRRSIRLSIHLVVGATALALTLALAGGCGAVELGSDDTGGDAIKTGKTCGTRGAAACASGSVCIFAESAACGSSDEGGSCLVPSQVCTADANPVCGCDGVTYGNECKAHAAGASIMATGACSGTPVTPVDGGGDATVALGAACGRRATGACAAGLTCIFPTGTDCGETDVGGTCQQTGSPCPQDIHPLCACDGKSYNNECAAHSAGVSVRKLGPC